MKEKHTPETLFNKLEYIVDSFKNQELLNKIGLAVIRIVRSRTRKGKDVFGRTFEPYSDAHAARREKFNLPTNVVNLQMNDIDGMLIKIDHVVSNDLDSVKVLIDDPEKARIASYHNRLGVGKAGAHIRQFWGLNDQEKMDIVKLVGEDLKQLILQEV